MQIIDDYDGKVYDCNLLDTGTLDTIVEVNGKAIVYSADYVAHWRDEDGSFNNGNLIELFNDAIEFYWESSL